MDGTSSQNGGPPFPEWVYQHHREIRVHLWRLTGSQADAEELAQETFLKALESWPTFRGEASVRTWLYRIATNLGINLLRNRKRETLFDEDDWTDGSGNAFHEASEREERAQIEEALHRLPPQQRAVVLLRIKDGLKFREIAEVMELSEGAIKAHYSFAVKRLRELLAGEEVRA